MDKLVVSEPWNFNGPSGRSELKGRVLRKYDQKTLLFESNDSVSMNGITGRYWLLSVRYADQLFDEKPYTGVVNGSLLSVIPTKEDDLAKLRKSSSFMIIGSLREEK